MLAADSHKTTQLLSTAKVVQGGKAGYPPRAARASARPEKEVTAINGHDITHSVRGARIAQWLERRTRD